MNQIKTAVIFNQFEEGISYHLFNGDHSNLHKIYINGTHDQKHTDALLALMYGSVEEPDILQGKVTLRKFRDAIINGAKVIECGFY